MPECVDCGVDVQNKNAAGHYRDRCCQCIINEATGGGRPIAGCECTDCQEARADS
jgi:hypothetical protein